MHTVLGVLILGGSSRERGVPRPVDEPAIFFGENNLVRANKKLVEG